MEDSELIFLVLKLIDDATLFSKDAVITEYENNKDAENLNELLYDKSIYPNGEKLGFYNFSKFTLNDFSEKRYSEREFKEYLNSFSIEIQELFILMKIDYFIFDKSNYITEEEWKSEMDLYNINTREKLQQRNSINYSKFNKNFTNYLLSSNGKYAKNKEDIQDIFIKRYFKSHPYFNYEEYSNFLKEVLFYNVEFKKNISILHIYPDSYFIFQCLDYIRKNNPKCNVNLYAIFNSDYDLFPLKFLAIINKINFKYIVHHPDYKPLLSNDHQFNDIDSFDFIIDSITLNKKNITINEILSNFKTSVSSRVLYIFPFSDTKNMNKKWFESDILESLITIPILDPKARPSQPTEIKSHLLIVLNYNKPKERRNKFIAIDYTKNKTITTAEYRIHHYRNLINNEKIYEKSFKQFSNFTDNKNSKIIPIDDIIRNNKNNEDTIEININDLLYDVKMDSQKNYYKINHREKDSSGKEHIVTKQLNYPIEKLGNLVKTGIPYLGLNNVLYALTNEKNIDKWIFLDFEIQNSALYRKLILTSDKVSLEYLYYYLNSEIGINEYEYFIRGHRVPTITPFFNEIRVPIPPLEIQDQIVNAMNKSKNFFNEVNQLKNRINNNFFDYKRNLNTMDEFYTDNIYSEETHEFSISNHREYTLSGLVWPLAITYLYATSGGLEKTETANNLLRLFEFTVAFNAIVLISGLPEEIYEQYKTRIWDYAYDKSNNNYKFKKSLKLTFGSWVEFTNLLSSAYKKEFETDLNKEFYINLLNKEIRKYYTKLKDERNEEFHSGISTAEDAKSLINELDIPKAKIFEHLNLCYNNFKLYYTTGEYSFKTNEYEVIFLNGAYSMPIYSTVHYKGFLEPESLYLYDTVEKKFSKLRDDLIKFKVLDEGKRDWRLYIFIGFETVDNTKKAVYKCYQLKEKNDPKEDIDLNEFM